MKNDIKADLEYVDNVITGDPNASHSHSVVDDLCHHLKIDTAAGKEFIRYSLANALLMERKQKDYGPHNISKFGAYGCVLRMSDKLERLIHLFNNRKRKTANESIADSFRDLSNYGIIAMICDDRKWPNE